MSFDESFPEAAAPAFRLNFALIEFQNRKKPVEPSDITDIGVGYVGFEVQGLNALLLRVKAAGAKVVSDSGIVDMGNGTQAVIVRDPDVGGFVETVRATLKYLFRSAPQRSEQHPGCHEYDLRRRG